MSIKIDPKINITQLATLIVLFGGTVAYVVRVEAAQVDLRNNDNRIEEKCDYYSGSMKEDIKEIKDVLKYMARKLDDKADR